MHVGGRQRESCYGRGEGEEHFRLVLKGRESKSEEREELQPLDRKSKQEEGRKKRAIVYLLLSCNGSSLRQEKEGQGQGVLVQKSVGIPQWALE